MNVDASAGSTRPSARDAARDRRDGRDGRDGRDNEVSLVSRSFLLLRAFRDAPVLGVSDLSRRTGLPRTTVHRLAHQLLDEGALSRVGSKFRVGPTLFELGNLHYPRPLRDALQPVLDDCNRTTGCSVSLLELVGSDVIVVIAATRGSRSTLGRFGQRIPAHACAGGQLLLSAEDSIPPGTLSALTPATITDRRALRRRLTEVRAAGSAVEHGEAEQGRSSVAVPVSNRNGRVLGSLMLAGDTKGFDASALTNMAFAFNRRIVVSGQKVTPAFFNAARPRTTA